jgi:hypothetical protein
MANERVDLALVADWNDRGHTFTEPFVADLAHRRWQRRSGTPCRRTGRLTGRCHRISRSHLSGSSAS